jgi:hypothetical protein
MHDISRPRKIKAIKRTQFFTPIFVKDRDRADRECSLWPIKPFGNVKTPS